MEAKDATEIQSAEEINYREIGKISEETKKTVTDAITEVFKRKGFKEEPPEVVSISQGAVVLPGGEEIEACYNFDSDNPGKPGKILVSAEMSKRYFGKSRIPKEVATAAFAAHEAVEHVNYMDGKNILVGTSKFVKHVNYPNLKSILTNSPTVTDIHANSETEQDANSTARQVIKDLYGWTVYFGDEKPPSEK